VLFAAAGGWPLASAGAGPAYAKAVLPSMLLWGVANALIMPSLFACADAVPRAELASGSAVLATARQLGTALGVAVFVAVVGAGAAGGMAGLDHAWIVVLVTAAMTAFAGLATGRRLIGVAQAEPARRAGPRPAVAGRRVVLRDGSKVIIRQVQVADAPLLTDGFARLSDSSRRMRFLARKDELTAAEVRYFTDLDHHDHEALGAVSQADGRGVGVARYVRDADDPQAAEIAVTVVDEWQGRGLGTQLLAELSGRARQEGIRRFTALAAADNASVAGLLRNMGAELVGYETGTVQYEIILAPSGERTPRWRAPLLDDPIRDDRRSAQECA
jgi:RimJ/RimL family protein N-acetyltransferase